MNDTLQKINTLLEHSTPEIRSVVLSGDIDTAVLALTTTYHLTVAEGVAVKNTVLFTLLGVVPTTEIKEDLRKNLSISEEDLGKLLKDIDAGIFEKARMKLFGEEHEKGQDVRTLNLAKEENITALREQIMSQTDRDSALKVSPLESMPNTPPAPKTLSAPGSRAALLEQLDVLGAIPNEDSVRERLKKIADEIAHIEATKVTTQTQEEEKEREEKAKDKASRPAISFPTQYNIDPYRELAEE